MSLPPSKPAQQQSIRTFFQPPKAAPPNVAQAAALAAKAAADATSAIVPTPSASQPPTPPSLPHPTAVPSQSPQPPPPRPPVTSATNPNLPREATIRAVEPADITALRRLNSLLLPVAFPDSFYQSVLDPAASYPYSRVITWHGDGNGLPEEPKIVGAIVCIPEPRLQSSDGAPPPSDSSSPPPTSLYIRSLGILAPYRSLGLANAALDDILAAAAAHAVPPPVSITAHVWTENDQGLQWYLRRGFERVGTPIEGYYRKLRPGTAILVSRPVRAAVLDALGSAAAAISNNNGSGISIRTSPPPRQVTPSVTAAIISRPPSTTMKYLDSDARPPPARGGSYQTQRSDMEWNDLPTDLIAASSLLLPKRGNSAGGGSESVSGASSRSSSSAAQRRKRDRSYPAAAFGN